jgi:hypothetical protein
MRRLGTRSVTVTLVAVIGAAMGAGAAAQSGGGVVYKCPGSPVLYTDALSPAEAKEKGCTTVEGAPVTVLQAPRPRTSAAASTPAATPTAATPRPEGSRVDASEQRKRDSDRRAILDSELRREQQKLAEMQREYNNGQPERLGSERNYQRYLDRVAQMKTDIERKESDIAAIQRELAKLSN